MSEADRTIVFRYLNSRGISPRFKGYFYLQSAIEAGLNSQVMLYKMSDLYQMVTVLYKIDACAIDNAIRYSLIRTGIRQTPKDFIITSLMDIKFSSPKKVFSNTMLF